MPVTKSRRRGRIAVILDFKDRKSCLEFLEEIDRLILCKNEGEWPRLFVYDALPEEQTFYFDDLVMIATASKRPERTQLEAWREIVEPFGGSTEEEKK